MIAFRARVVVNMSSRNSQASQPGTSQTLYSYFTITSVQSPPENSEDEDSSSGAASPTSYGQVSDAGSPTSYSQVSDAGSPTSHSQLSDAASPTSYSQLSEAGSPTSYSHLSETGSATSYSHLSETASPTSYSQLSGTGSPTSSRHVSDPDQYSSAIMLQPCQPRNKVFPPTKFVFQSRSFQVGWFDRWKWLDWDDSKSCVYCHPCRMAVRLHFTLSKKAEPAFSQVGFRNWKDATRCFRKHETSYSHKEANLKWVHYSKSHSVAAQLSKQLQSDQIVAQKCLLRLISSLRFLARQGLAVRGHDEAQGNLLQLLQLRSEDCSELCNWMERRDNWLSHDVQNEISPNNGPFNTQKDFEFCKTQYIFYHYC